MKTLSIVLILLASLVGCTPTVQLAAPKEPIEINLNIKIEHRIRIQVDKELEGLFDDDSDIF
ncbi:MAG: YnbE family lipoprotein [Proteobacteria bacterium]|nr:YnbE family lipoprotein [Pseudomonadota bacterium]